MSGQHQEFIVPYVTLNRHVKGSFLTTIPGRKPKLGILEKELSKAVNTLQDFGKGARKQDVLVLASDTAKEGGLSPFKGESATPSNNWYRGFMKRNNRTLRQPENMSVPRFRSK